MEYAYSKTSELTRNKINITLLTEDEYISGLIY